MLPHPRASTEYLLSRLCLPVSDRLNVVQVPADRVDRAVARNGVVERNGVDAGLSGGSRRGRSRASRGVLSAVSNNGGNGGGGGVCPRDVPSLGHAGKAAPDESGKANKQGHEEVHDGQH